MASRGYVLASAIDEDSVLSEYWAGAGRFTSNLDDAQFFASATNTIVAMRVEEGALQQANSAVDIRLTNATQRLSLSTDNESCSGWIYASAPSETADIDAYYDGTGFVAELDAAELFSKIEGSTLASARQEEGRFQSRFTDRDVRLLPAKAVITIE